MHSFSHSRYHLPLFVGGDDIFATLAMRHNDGNHRNLQPHCHCLFLSGDCCNQCLACHLIIHFWAKSKNSYKFYSVESKKLRGLRVQFVEMPREKVIPRRRNCDNLLWRTDGQRGTNLTPARHSRKAREAVIGNWWPRTRRVWAAFRSEISNAGELSSAVFDAMGASGSDAIPDGSLRYTFISR